MHPVFVSSFSAARVTTGSQNAGIDRDPKLKSNCLQGYNLGRDALPTPCVARHCDSFARPVGTAGGMRASRVGTNGSEERIPEGSRVNRCLSICWEFHHS